VLICCVWTGHAGDATSKLKGSKGKTDKKGGKDDRSTEKLKSTKEVIKEKHAEVYSFFNV